MNRLAPLPATEEATEEAVQLAFSEEGVELSFDEEGVKVLLNKRKVVVDKQESCKAPPRSDYQRSGSLRLTEMIAGSSDTLKHSRSKRRLQNIKVCSNGNNGKFGVVVVNGSKGKSGHGPAARSTHCMSNEPTPNNSSLDSFLQESELELSFKIDSQTEVGVVTQEILSDEEDAAQVDGQGSFSVFELANEAGHSRRSLASQWSQRNLTRHASHSRLQALKRMDYLKMKGVGARLCKSTSAILNDADINVCTKSRGKSKHRESYTIAGRSRKREQITRQKSESSIVSYARPQLQTSKTKEEERKKSPGITEGHFRGLSRRDNVRHRSSTGVEGSQKSLQRSRSCRFHRSVSRDQEDTQRSHQSQPRSKLGARRASRQLQRSVSTKVMGDNQQSRQPLHRPKSLVDLQSGRSVTIGGSSPRRSQSVAEQGYGGLHTSVARDDGDHKNDQLRSLGRSGTGAREFWSQMLQVEAHTA